MSDDPTAPKAAGTPAGIYEHWCEHPGCKAWGGWGYQRGKDIHWYCGEHRHEADKEHFGR